jgi:2'-5' RNA ligase
MVLRAIVIFPAFVGDGQAAEIERLRQAYDPLAEVIPAHITLAFPFESELEAGELEAHMRAAARGIGRFVVELREITGQEGEYLFLNVKRGNDAIIALHDRLYTGPLAEHLSPAHTFVPHLTVGRLANAVAFNVALRQARRVTGTTTFLAEARAMSLYRIEEGRRAVQRVIELE